MMLAIAGYGCGSGNLPSTKNPFPQSQPAAAPPPTQQVNIYRYLSALDDAHQNSDELTSLCMRKHNFKLELPTTSVKSAHNIRLPASEEWTEVEQIERQKYRSVTHQPPDVNGIVMQPVEKQIPYTVSESIEVKKRISGICIGIEYITEQDQA